MASLSKDSDSGTSKIAKPPQKVSDTPASFLPPTGPYQTTSGGQTFKPIYTTPKDGESRGWEPIPVTGQLGPYELLAEIAQGGMGVIYKARHMTLGRIVALKTIRGASSENYDQLPRFAREVQAVAKLSHPNIVPIYDVNLEHSRPYYTMAFVGGGNLAQARRRFADNPAAAATLVEKIARAVQFAHEQGILHRDLKPANILLDEQGEPHISDFGLAKFRDQDMSLTRTGAILGTPAYMAPEQAEGRTNLASPATDVWALGVILFELVTGQRPFAGADTEEVKRQVLHVEPPNPRSLQPALDPKLEIILLKSLEKDPKRRYSTAMALADDLHAWVNGEPISARPDSRPMKAWRKVRRHPRLLAGTAFLAIAFAVVLTLFYYNDRPMKEMTRQLAVGEKVTLVGETGMPKWRRWAHGQGTIKNEGQNSDSLLTIQCWDVCVLELLRAVPIERYRVRAEIKHLDNKFDGEVGLCVGYTKADPCDYFIGAMYNDILDSAKAAPKANLPGNLAFLNLMSWVKQSDGNDGAAREQLASTYFQPAGEMGQKEWRPISIEVSPEAVKCFWYDKALKPHVSKEYMDRLSRGSFAIKPGFTVTIPTLKPKGGIGLYVSRGEASFRNVEVEPIK